VPSGAFSEGSKNLFCALVLCAKDFLKAEKAEPRRADGRGISTERVFEGKLANSGEMALYGNI
jgi:hypothetical protein